MEALSTDTAVQAAVGQEIGDVSVSQKGQIQALLSEVQALQAQFQGEAGMATQAKASQLHEVGIALMAEFDSISERVGHSTTGYINTDTDGAGMINSSAGVAF